MYRKDVIVLWTSMIFAGLISWKCQFPYEKVASDAITIVSIADAVYVAAVTLLIGSRTAEAMKHQDLEIKTKTKMGVFVSYLKWAIIVGILSIVVSVVSKAYFSEFDLKKISDTFLVLRHIVFTTGSMLFVGTLFFIMIIFKFLSTTLLNESHSSEER